MKAILLDNARDFVASLGELIRDFKKSTLIVVIISLSLAIPVLILVLANNFSSLSKGLFEDPQITLFIQKNANQFIIQDLTKSLQQNAQITKVQYLSKEQTLAEFTENLAIAPRENLLQNPLPAVLIAHLNPSITANSAAILLQQLQKMPMITMAQLDLDWLQKLQAIVDFIYASAIILLLILTITTITIIANTIHLKIDSLRQTIQVLQLLGASKAFIQRPLLYQGFWYGALGGTIATALVYCAIAVLNHHVSNIALLYNSNFVLYNLDFATGCLVILIGGTLGVLGAWVTMRHSCSR